MAKRVMIKSMPKSAKEFKIAVTAEAFGFGPSASAKKIVDELREFERDGGSQCKLSIVYLGHSHTLQMQEGGGYDQIVNCARVEHFRQRVKHFDLLISVMDFDLAKVARQEGVRVLIYDNLLWYWRQWQGVGEWASYYVAQDFFNVEPRLTELKKRYDIPIFKVSTQRDKRVGVAQEGERGGAGFNLAHMSESELKVVLNFGGLENPYWSVGVCEQYVQKISTSLIAAFRFLNLPVELKIFSSQACATSLNEKPLLQNYKEEFLGARALLCTCGLGNILESYTYQKPTIFLPSANDSQGQQMVLVQQNLQRYGGESCFLDWREVNPRYEVDYFMSQKSVMQKIQENILQVSTQELERAFIKRLERSIFSLKPGVLEECMGDREGQMRDIFKEVIG